MKKQVQCFFCKSLKAQGEPCDQCGLWPDGKMATPDDFEIVPEWIEEEVKRK